MSDYVAIIKRTGSSDELQHWKYISKKKVNGKWRYYYDVDKLKDDLGYDEREEAYKQHDYVMTIGALRKRQNKRYNDALPKFGPATNKQQKRIDEEKAELNKINKKYSEEAKKYYEKQAAFHKTPIGKIDKLVEGAKEVVENILSKDIWKDFQKSKSNRLKSRSKSR